MDRRTEGTRMAGQSLSQIRALLAGAGITPRHRLGQNFLFDQHLMRKLLDAAEVGSSDVILEIGPGTGSLTELLLERGARVIGVEIDRGLAAILRGRLGDDERFTLVEGDVLESKSCIHPDVLELLRGTEPQSGGARKLVANLPYQVATPLIMELFHVTPTIERMVCTIQKEVGERFGAVPDTEAYGPVSVVSQTLATIRSVANLPPSVFWPRPKVESLMIDLRRRPADEIEVDDIAGFVAFVRDGFQQRRKMLRRLLRDQDAQAGLEAFARAEVSPDCRPAELSPARWRALHKAMRTLR